MKQEISRMTSTLSNEDMDLWSTAGFLPNGLMSVKRWEGIFVKNEFYEERNILISMLARRI